MKRVVIFGLGLAVAACQSLPRQYDGVLGYKIEARSPSALSILYTDSAKKSWQDMEDGVRAVCAKETGKPVEEIQLVVKLQKEFSQQVDMSIATPVGMTGAAAPTAGGQTGSMKAAIPMTEKVYREMALKKMQADCRL